MEPYIIRPGDTLYSISRDHHVPLPALLKLNSIADPDSIRAGRQILLPSLTSDTDEAHAVRPQIVTLPAGAPPLNQSLRLARGQYFEERHPKDLIVLHFTAGSTARGAFQSWQSTPVEVGAAYILDRDGTIYETFPAECWAYHLGIQGAESAGHRHDRRSIGIEIVNPGGLRRRGDDLYWWPAGYTTHWCRASDAEIWRYHWEPFRGMDYWATFTHEQYAALPVLVRWLTEVHQIEYRPVAEDKAGVMDWDYFRHFRGIASHQNFRADKTDIGPAFDWSVLRPGQPLPRPFPPVPKAPPIKR
jgi:N-acetyl-anhydromuramyl-L-alanine amidase AmpD